MADLIYLNSNILPMLNALGAPIDKAVKNAGDAIVDDIIVSMTQSKHGRVYETGGNHITGASTHQASAPGEAPAVQTAELLNSLRVEQTQRMEGGGALSEAIAYTDKDYGANLEIGTARIARRPYMEPAADTVFPDYVGEVSEAIRQVLERFAV